VLRRKRGLTLSSVSALSGVGRSNISRAEVGKQMPRVDTLRKIVEAMGRSLGDLYRAQEIVTEAAGGPNQAEAAEEAPQQRRELLGRRDLLPLLSHSAAVAVAREVGRATAHLVLSLLELRAGGWPKGQEED
jgi:transcriptional regulator with XRE-family HTH domain